MGSVLVTIFQFLNNSKRNARQPGQLPDLPQKKKRILALHSVLLFQDFELQEEISVPLFFRILLFLNRFKM